MKFNYLNTIIAVGSGEYIGSIGIFGHEAEGPEQALDIALEAAAETRKIMGFPVVARTKLEFERMLVSEQAGDFTS